MSFIRNIILAMVALAVGAVVIFSSVVFSGGGAMAAAVLYGVTGDGANTPETLYTLDMADASSTFVMTLGAGQNGESIAYNPDDGLMYHTSGRGAQAWESIDLSGPSILSSIESIASCIIICGIRTLTYNESTGIFLAADENNFMSITPDGTISVLGTSARGMKGLAFVGNTLFGVTNHGVQDDRLLTVDPFTGATLSSLTLNYSGAINGFTGLAANPDTNELWGIMRSNGGNRLLVTINSSTGDVSSVGNLGDSFAGIAFAQSASPVSAPGALLLLGFGLVGVGLRRGRT